MNYLSLFLSLWIANLGVVPLFLFSAFLFLPRLFFLFFLMMRTFFVNEPISLILVKNTKILRPLVLGLCLLFVKGALGDTVTMHRNVFMLSKGEQKILKLKSPLKRYSIGNRELMKIKVLNSRKLLIKAKKMGFTDLKIWLKKGSLHHKFYILSKYDQLKKNQYIEAFNHFGVKASPIGKKILLEGTLKEYQKYQHALKLIQANSKLFINTLKLDQELKREILAIVYQELIQNHFQIAKCSFNEIRLWCSYPNKAIPKEFRLYLKNKYGAHLVSLGEKKITKNYQLALKLVSLANQDALELKTGLNPLPTDWNTILAKTSYQDLISPNAVFAQTSNLTQKMLVTKELLLIPEVENQFRVGTEIPYTTMTQNGAQTNWRFAGLELKVKLKNKGSELYLDYEFTLSQPASNNIVGSVEKGSILIKKHRTFNLFKLTLEDSHLELKTLPLINRIPILREIFGMSDQVESQKTILALVALKSEQE